MQANKYVRNILLILITLLIINVVFWSGYSLSKSDECIPILVAAMADANELRGLQYLLENNRVDEARKHIDAVLDGLIYNIYQITKDSSNKEDKESVKQLLICIAKKRTNNPLTSFDMTKETDTSALKGEVTKILDRVLNENKTSQSKEQCRDILYQNKKHEQ